MFLGFNFLYQKYANTKAFTTIDDKGTEHDKENRATVTKNKSSQGNMMAKQNISSNK